MTEKPRLEDSMPSGPALVDGESMRLLTRYKSGDPEALNQLLARYQARIRRIVRIRLGSRLREQVESLDIVQETNQVAMERLATFEAKDSAGLIRWLSVIALNQVRAAADYFDAQKRDRGRTVPLQTGLPPAAQAPELDLRDEEALPEERAWRNELREILDDSMTKLEESHREVILQRDYYGSDWTAVARELGRTVPAARDLHQRAWAHLRRIARPRLRGIV